MTSVLLGCSHKPKLSTPESAIESLDGRNYQTPVGLHDIHEGYSRTLITGTLLIHSSLNVPEPLRHQKIILKLGQTEVATAVSDGSGAFTFGGEFANGEYLILLDSTRYKAAQNLTISKYKIDGVQVFATEK